MRSDSIGGTLGKLRLKPLESGVIHTVTLKQTDMRKKNKIIAAAVYLYQADNDGEWGELRFDFENGTAEIVKLADWDTVKSNVFAKTAIQFVQRLPEARLLKSVVVPFEMDVLERPLPLTKAAKESNGNSSHTISLRQTAWSGITARLPNGRISRIPCRLICRNVFL